MQVAYLAWLCAAGELVSYSRTQAAYLACVRFLNLFQPVELKGQLQTSQLHRLTDDWCTVPVHQPLQGVMTAMLGAFCTQPRLWIRHLYCVEIEGDGNRPLQPFPLGCPIVHKGLPVDGSVVDFWGTP